MTGSQASGQATGHTPAPLWLYGVVAALCILPVFLTPVLPFVDFYAHIARYFALAQADEIANVGAHYTPHWVMLPNLGLDLLGTTLMEVLPPLFCAKIIALITLLAPGLGVLALARVLHGQIHVETLLIAGILCFNHIIFWGFSNFLIGLGLGLGGIALWLHLANRPGLQLGLTALFGLVLIFVHGLAFALWGLLLGTVELMRAWQARDLHLLSLARRMGRLALLAVLPVLLFTQMNTAQAQEGISASFSNLAGYVDSGQLAQRLIQEVWDRADTFLRVADSANPWADRLTGILLWGLILVGYLRGYLRLHPLVWLAVALAALLVIAMPPNFFGVGRVDERIPLVLLALIGAGSVRHMRAPRAWLLGLGGFLVLKTVMVSASFLQAATVYERYLNTLATTDTGQIAAYAPFGGTSNSRDRFDPNCRPLLFLLLLENHTAVQTFANPTQQPIRLKGALDQAHATHRQQIAAQADKTGDRTQAQTLSQLFEAGFDTVVSCDTAPPEALPAGITRVAGHAPWALYQPATPN